MNYENPMQKPRIAKVTVNIGAGESGEKLVKAESLVSKITNKKPVRTVSTHRIPTWGIKKGDPIGCKVTLRGADADEFLKRAFTAKGNILRESSFDSHGNFAFGIAEYIDMPGMKYDPDIGIMGFEVSITMERPGYSVKRRRLNRSRIPVKAIINKEESIDYITEKFNINVVGAKEDE